MSVADDDCVRLPRGVFARMATFGLMPTWCLLAVVASFGSGGTLDGGAVVLGVVGAILGGTVMKIEVVVCRDELRVGVGPLQRRVPLHRFVGCGEGAVAGFRGYTTIGVVLVDRHGRRVACPMSQWTSRRERPKWIEQLSLVASLEPMNWTPEFGKERARGAWDRADDDVPESVPGIDPRDAIATVHQARVGAWIVRVRPAGTRFHAVVTSAIDGIEVDRSDHPTRALAVEAAIGFIDRLERSSDVRSVESDGE